jgi:hypothetical protein
MERRFYQLQSLLMSFSVEAAITSPSQIKPPPIISKRELLHQSKGLKGVLP